MAAHQPTVQDEAIQQQVTDLVQQVKSLLDRPTRANFKQAIQNCNRILGYGKELNDEQRTQGQNLLEEANQKYEAFSQENQELVTARQVANLEAELVATRKLVEASKETGPDGENLAERFTELLEEVRGLQIKVSGEKQELAHCQIEDAKLYLSLEQAEAAVESYGEAIALLEGERIKGLDPNPDLKTSAAIASIKKNLVNEAVSEKVRQYQKGLRETERQREALVRIKPIYTDAQSLYEKGEYAQAFENLETIPEYAPDQFKSTVIEGLQERTLQGWIVKTLERARELLNKARDVEELGEYEDARNHAQQLENLGLVLQNKIEKHPGKEQLKKGLEEIKARRKEGTEILDRIRTHQGKEKKEREQQEQETVQDLVKKARDLVEKKEYLQAAGFLTDARQRDPRDQRKHEIDRVGMQIIGPIEGMVGEEERKAQAAHDLLTLRAALRKQAELQEVLKRISSVRANVSSAPDSEPLRLQSLDAWEQALKDITEPMGRAETLHTQSRVALGRSGDDNKRCSEAKDTFEQARNIYDEVVERMQDLPPISDDFSSRYPAVRELQNRVNDRRGKVEEARKQCVEGLEQANKELGEVRSLQARARRSLDEDDLGDAISLANEALRRCADLSDDLRYDIRRIIREAEARREEARFAFPSGAIIGGVVVLLLALVFVLGPGFWGWVFDMPL
jgi:hypothetical protein